MPAEWNDISAAVSHWVARQPPPVPVFFWLGVAFVVLMFVEGLRVSFVPRRFKDHPHSAKMKRPQQQQSTSPMVRSNPEALFVRVQRSNPMRYRKLVSQTPRRSQPFRPKIRRAPSPVEIAAASTGEPQPDFDDRLPQPEHVSQADD